MASYSEATAADPTLIALRDRVEFDFRPGLPNTLAQMELELTDGRRLTTSYDAGVPASDIAEQGRRLEEKFSSLAEPILGGAKTRDLIGEIGRIDTTGRSATRDADVRNLKPGAAFLRLHNARGWTYG